MKGIKRVNANPAEQNVQNFMAAVNAYAEQQQKNGEPAEFLSAANARPMYEKLIKTAIALSDASHAKHNEAYNALTKQFGRNSTAVDYLRSMGEGFSQDIRTLSDAAMKRGVPAGKAFEGAFNSLAGNPVFDHFANLNVLAGQLYQEMSFMDAWQSHGDSFALPLEPGSTGLDVSRFRAPVEQVVGSAKIMQGDINPKSHLQDDNNRTQLSLFNEFKNAVTLDAVFSITQAMRDQVLGYERTVAPALAGFILQNRYFNASQKQTMKLAELVFAGGQDSAGTYTRGVGGSYGLLSTAIQLQLSDWDAATPSVASTADWLDNPTKLIQKIQNKIYVMPTTAQQQLVSSVASQNMYGDIIRLFQLPAQANVNFAPQEWALFVPSTWYALAMQYPSSGTFNKQLQEMVNTAVGGNIFQKVTTIPSSLLNYGAGIGAAGTTPYNYMVLCALGCRSENKPVILPGQTALPVVTSESVSASIMNFRTQFVTGGPMVMQYGGTFLLEFSYAA